MIVAIHRVSPSSLVYIHVDGMQVGPDIARPDSRESGGMESEPVPSLPPAPSLPPGPEWAGGREVESLLHLSPEEAQSWLQQEAIELGRERAQQSRVAASVSSLMYRDVQVGGCGWMGVCAGGHGAGEGEGPAEQGGRQHLQPHVQRCAGECVCTHACVRASQTEMQCKVMGDPHHVQIRHLKYLLLHTHSIHLYRNHAPPNKAKP